MKSHREPPFNTKKTAKQWPKLGGEQQAFIGNNWIRQIMMSNYHVENDFGYPWSIDVDLYHLIINNFYKLIDDDYDRVITITFSVSWNQ